jgi:hypothetical protein
MLLSEIRAEVQRRKEGREGTQMEVVPTLPIPPAPPPPQQALEILSNSIPRAPAFPPPSTPRALEYKPTPIASNISNSTASSDLPPAIAYTGWGKENRTPEQQATLRAIEHVPLTPRALPTTAQGPVRAIENVQNRSPPDSFYPKSLRKIDPDLQPPLPGKRGKKGGKSSQVGKKQERGGVRGGKIFTPSPPIEASLELPPPPSPNSLRGKKRSPAHLSKPRPTLAIKRVKNNRGEKREGNFQDGPSKKKKTNYDLWTFN